MKKSIKKIGIIAIMVTMSVCSYMVGTTQAKTETVIKEIEVIPQNYISLDNCIPLDDVCGWYYDKYDYILGMDHWNLKNMLRILKSDPEDKVKLLLDYSDDPRDIADPWYTGGFDVTYSDVVEGCEAFLEYLKDKKKL